MLISYYENGFAAVLVCDNVALTLHSVAEIPTNSILSPIKPPFVLPFKVIIKSSLPSGAK